MKKLITILMLLISSLVFSQLKTIQVEKPIEIGKIAPMGQFIISIEKYESGNKYLIMYKDFKFQHITEIKSFSFLDENNAFEDLYSMIMKGFETMPADDSLIELGGKHVWFHYEKSLGVPLFRFAHAEDKNANVIGFSQLLTKKQVAKLFGKNK